MISKVNLGAIQIIWVFVPNENFVVYGKKEKKLKGLISIWNTNDRWKYKNHQ